MSDAGILVSVVIPTFNRVEALRRTLASLCDQALSVERYEVIVVDDGSSDGTEKIAAEPFHFPLRYNRQSNRGATAARNAGALAARGEVLVFLDDDIAVSRETLSSLAEECRTRDRTLVMGTLVFPSEVLTSPFARIMAAGGASGANAAGSLDYTLCKTGLLAVRRADFMAIGMFNDPTGGWPNWDDVDFGCRAHALGYRLYRSVAAVGTHWDYSLTSLGVYCRRSYEASRSAAGLFRRYPELGRRLPMFNDMTPVAWGRDPAGLVCRKLARRAASTRPPLRLLEVAVAIVERVSPQPALLRPLYRWVHGAYVFRGYRNGLRGMRV